MEFARGDLKGGGLKGGLRMREVGEGERYPGLLGGGLCPLEGGLCPLEGDTSAMKGVPTGLYIVGARCTYGLH